MLPEVTGIRSGQTFDICRVLIAGRLRKLAAKIKALAARGANVDRIITTGNGEPRIVPFDLNIRDLGCEYFKPGHWHSGLLRPDGKDMSFIGALTEYAANGLTHRSMRPLSRRCVT